MDENNTNTNIDQAQEGQEGQDQKQPKNETTFTLEEVTKLIQQEADKRVTQALKKQKTEFDKKLALNGMGEQERAMAEKDQTIADLNERLQELTAYKSRANVLAALSEAKLPATGADVILVDPNDEEGNLARVKALGDYIQQAIEEGIKTRLAGKAPATATSGAKPDYSKMSDADYYAQNYKKK